MKSTLLILFFCFLFPVAYGQTDTNNFQNSADTTVKIILHSKNASRNRFRDSSNIYGVNDSVVKIKSIVDTLSSKLNNSSRKESALLLGHPLDSIYLKLLDNPFFRSKQKPIYLVINERLKTSKDEMFYILLAIIFFLAIFKLSFSRYFNNIFHQLFQPTFRQKQTREQLSQNNFPSLLLNLFFILSGGAFIALVMQYYNLTKSDFTTTLAYCTAILLFLYVSKFLLLSFAGWVFNAKEATETYIFIVFLINKILGIILLPITFIIAFSSTEIVTFSLTLAFMLVFILFIYRYIASFGPVRKEIKMSILHFIFYILAFEIIPLLLIYKTLGIYLGKST